MKYIYIYYLIIAITYFSGSPLSKKFLPNDIYHFLHLYKYEILALCYLIIAYNYGTNSANH